MSRRLVVLLLLAAVFLGAVAGSASPSSRLIKGIYDETNSLYGNPDKTYPLLSQLRVKAIRMNLYWGGRFGVSLRKPGPKWMDPDEPGTYDWRLYDRAMLYAAQYKIPVVFSIYGTPKWANGGKGANVAPKNPLDLYKFAYAAAARYNGVKINNDGRLLPAVKMWLAWNEPNNPAFLTPQYKRVGGKWVIQSARDYAKICNAIYRGIKATLTSGEKVACGVTAPRGNNSPTAGRPSVSPLAFLRAAKAAGLTQFDFYAHHPYYGRPAETPTTKPPVAKGATGKPTAVTLANIGDLLKELTRLYGPKHLWITEYGYQTSPPDKYFGVTYAKQAAYLKQAYAIARKNPRIDMMLWFLLRDEPLLGGSIDTGWQSGFFTNSGQKKPAFNAFRLLP